MSLSAETVANNLAVVRQRISEAAKKSGRAEQDILLVAVTKYVDATTTRLLVDAGCTCLGESRPQLLWEKASQLADLTEIQWHQIGHMQRNKVARTLPMLSLLQSVDSERLLNTVNDQSQKHGLTTPILLEVNISGDSNKHGLDPNSVESVVRSTADLKNVSLRGVMGMASREGGADRARRDFSALRELRDSIASACPENASLHEISMGMSGDFEVAIEEGATIVRVGSALFTE